MRLVSKKSIAEIYENQENLRQEVQIFDAEHKRFMQELLGRRCANKTNS
jgi:hypothetical protein